MFLFFHSKLNPIPVYFPALYQPTMTSRKNKPDLFSEITENLSFSSIAKWEASETTPSKEKKKPMKNTKALYFSAFSRKAIRPGILVTFRSSRVSEDMRPLLGKPRRMTSLSETLLPGFPLKTATWDGDWAIQQHQIGDFTETLKELVGKRGWVVIHIVTAMADVWRQKGRRRKRYSRDPAVVAGTAGAVEQIWSIQSLSNGPDLLNCISVRFPIIFFKIQVE